MKSINRLLLTLILLSLHSVLHASSWSASNLGVVDNFAIPTFQELNTSSQQLVKSSADFCISLDEKNFKGLKQAFHQTMDDWQIAQILRSGPAMKSMRFYRLEMWPDRSNAATRHLKKLKQEADLDSLKPENFSKASTAVQGLSALERLLFGKTVKLSDFQTKNKANFNCALIQTISQNIQTISNELLQAWQQSYRVIITQPGKDNDLFESDKSASAQFLNDLNTQLQVILTQKLKRPINGSRFRLTRAESWRSQRSLRNIRLNLLASKKLYNVAFVSQMTDKKILNKQQALFDDAINRAKKLERPLQVVHDEHAEELQQWIAVITSLKTSINSELPMVVDIPLGFNSQDGD